jgi:hypothetical protein
MNTTPSPAAALLPPLSGSLSFDPADPEIHWILGRPCFFCGPIAHILQSAGHEIPKRAEDEQAAVIVWLIRKYQQHGEGWRAKVDEELRAFRKANRESSEPKLG